MIASKLTITRKKYQIAINQISNKLQITKIKSQIGIKNNHSNTTQ